MTSNSVFVSIAWNHLKFSNTKYRIICTCAIKIKVVVVKYHLIQQVLSQSIDDKPYSMRYGFIYTYPTLFLSGVAHWNIATSHTTCKWNLLQTKEELRKLSFCNVGSFIILWVVLKAELYPRTLDGVHSSLSLPNDGARHGSFHIIPSALL